MKAVVLDAPDSWAQRMETEGVISKFVPINFADAEHVYDNCLKVRQIATLAHSHETSWQHAVLLLTANMRQPLIPGVDYRKRRLPYKYRQLGAVLVGTAGKGCRCTGMTPSPNQHRLL